MGHGYEFNEYFSKLNLNLEDVGESRVALVIINNTVVTKETLPHLLDTTETLDWDRSRFSQ